MCIEFVLLMGSGRFKHLLLVIGSRLESRAFDAIRKLLVKSAICFLIIKKILLDNTGKVGDLSASLVNRQLINVFTSKQEGEGNTGKTIKKAHIVPLLEDNNSTYTHLIHRLATCINLFGSEPT